MPMTKPQIRYVLRAHRRSAGLSQKEVATLLGLESAAHVCHIEQGRRDPSFLTALAYAALFGAPLGELFPQTAQQAIEGLTKQAGALHDQIRYNHALRSTHKAKFLRTVPCSAFHSATHSLGVLG